jgi:two-component system, sensor histidine kinase PdtaS
MSILVPTQRSTFEFLWEYAFDFNADEQKVALEAKLQASLAREEMLREEKRDLLKHHVMLAQELEHRFLNGLQLVAGLLSLQGRTAARTPEAAFQLTSAARRIMALGRVHHQLHLRHHHENVELKQFMADLCEELSDLLFEERNDHSITVEGDEVEIPAILATPLGFIVNELITNSVKYAKSDITVRIETTASACYSLSVLDEGPGLPAGFDTAKCGGLGMKLVLSLVKQIGGELQIVPRSTGHAARFTVLFRSAN